MGEKQRVDDRKGSCERGEALRSSLERNGRDRMMQLAKGCMLDSRHGNDNIVNCLCRWKEEVHIHSKVGQLTISDIKQTAVRLWPHSRTQNKKSVPIHRVTSAAEDARWIDRLWESVPGLSYTRWLPTTLNSQRRRNSETWRPSFVFSANFTRAKTVRKISARGEISSDGYRTSLGFLVSCEQHLCNEVRPT